MLSVIISQRAGRQVNGMIVIFYSHFLALLAKDFRRAMIKKGPATASYSGEILSQFHFLIGKAKTKIILSPISDFFGPNLMPI